MEEGRIYAEAAILTGRAINRRNWYAMLNDKRPTTSTGYLVPPNPRIRQYDFPLIKPTKE